MQPITCEPLTVAWFYTGPDSSIDLIVTNVGVPQDLPQPSLTTSVSRTANTFTDSRRAVPTGVSKPILAVTTQIATDIDPLQFSYSWSSVNIAAGWYTFNARMPEYQYNPSSQPVFVHQGNDTSCLTSIPSSSSSSSSSDPSSTSSTSSTSSPSSIVIPIGGSSHTSVGTIIGVSLGAVALISMVLAAWLCLHRRARGTGGANANRWNGLSSVDSRMLTNSKLSNGRHHQPRSTSIGTIPVGSDEAVGAEKNSVYGKHNDPYGHLDGPGVALSAMPVLQHQAPRGKIPSRTYSASSSTSNVFSSNEHIPASGTGARRPSVPDSVLGRRSIDSTNTYPPVSPTSPHGRSANNTYAPNVSRSPSLSTNLTHQQNLSQSTSSHAGLLNQFQIAPANTPFPQSHSDPSSPVSPTTKDTTAKDSKRHSLGGRKRKPVPAYDPSQDPLSPSLSPSLAPSPIPPPSPTPEPMIGSGSGLSTTAAVAAVGGGGGGGHYSTRNQSGRDNSEHELVHKSSFGPGGVEGKPLHYLIPDMPMAMRD